MRAFVNKIFIRVIVAVVSACTVVSCSNEEYTAAGTGLRISLSDDVEVMSRSTPSEIGGPVLSQFHLKINKQGNAEMLYNDGYTAELISLPVGSYQLKASFGKNEVLALDAPYYEGTGEAQIVAGRTTQATIPCRVANALLSVKYVNQETFDNLYSSYGVKVQVQNLSALLSGNAGNVSAYFRAGSSVLATFCATLKDNGQEISMPIKSESFPEVFAARDHAILKLSAQVAISGVILTVDTVEVEKVTVTQTIPMEWLPKPKVNGFSNGATSLTYTETADAIPAELAYTASMPVQDVEFTLNFEDEQLAPLNKTYTLSTLSTEDNKALNKAGITLPVLDGISKQGVIDFTNLTANLQTNAGLEVVNTISVRVKANDRWSEADGSNYEIHTIRPDFTLSIQPENIWAKEFTTDEVSVITGNADKIKANLVYQYSDDGGASWLNFNDNSNRRQAFASLPDNRNYKVRANFRSVFSNIAEAVLEEPKQLPNSDMETWQINNLGKISFLDGSKSFYDFLPYTSGESDIWWATNNARARDYSVSRVQVTSSSCVSCAENTKHGGNRSALIYTSGHGGGYASTSIAVYPGGAFAGSMFIGTYNWADKKETTTTGHAFDSRPQEFSFWYKYQPKNSDQFKVYVELRNNSDVIASGTYIPDATSTSDTDFSQATIPLIYSNFQKKATAISVQFLSTTKTSFVRSDFDNNKKIDFPVMGSWKAHIGSMLYIDDLSLNYTK